MILALSLHSQGYGYKNPGRTPLSKFVSNKRVQDRVIFNCCHQVDCLGGCHTIEWPMIIQSLWVSCSCQGDSLSSVLLQTVRWVVMIHSVNRGPFHCVYGKPHTYSGCQKTAFNLLHFSKIDITSCISITALAINASKLSLFLNIPTSQHQPGWATYSHTTQTRN